MEIEPRSAADRPRPVAGRPVAAAVWTRSLDGVRMAGRLRIAHAIRSVLVQSTALKQCRLRSIVDEFTLSRFLGATWVYLVSLARGRPLPLQCAIFASPAETRRTVAAIPADAEVVYLDGVRCCEVLKALRRSRPALRLVVDLDDLMSRRMELLLSVGQPLSLGYMKARIPGVLHRLFESRALGRLIVRYEFMTLRRLEREILSLADDVVLLSSADADVLRARRPAGAPSARVTAIAPPIASKREARDLDTPVRFVFVGDDALTQNRLTIDYLVALWRERRLSAPLVFYGQHRRVLDFPDGVSAHGYVESLGEIYSPSSILITPSFLAGGVKTKVLEAFSFGLPVVGNRVTFEAMPIEGYELLIDDEAELVRLIEAPEEQIDRFNRAARTGARYVQRHHAQGLFEERWRAAVTSPRASPAADDAPLGHAFEPAS